jgi:hypothetical protein
MVEVEDLKISYSIQYRYSITPSSIIHVLMSLALAIPKSHAISHANLCTGPRPGPTGWAGRNRTGAGTISAEGPNHFFRPYLY